MDTREFLAHVLPSTGPYCIARDWKNSKGEKGYQQFAAVDLDEATALSLQLDQGHQNVFFALGALIVGRYWDTEKGKWKVSRSGDNIRGVRSYILDIDAGEKRQYATVQDAAHALKQFVTSASLPKPTVTSSGNGLHVYWPMLDEVPPEEWNSNAVRLKEMAISYGLNVDPNWHPTSASVLRVAGTHNYKYNPPPLVETWVCGPRIANAQFHALLGSTSHEVALVHGPAPVTVDFGSNTNRYEDTLLDFRKGVENCAALAFTIDPANQAQGKIVVPERAWFASLLLAAFMHKGRQAAHLMSQYDPRYSAAGTDQKFDQLLKAKNEKAIGPTTCAEFQRPEIYGTTHCLTCPSYNKIKSPAVVMRYIAPVPQEVVQEKAVDGAFIARVIPDVPNDFQRLPNGGIGIKTANSKTGAKDVIEFCPYNLYPVRLRYDERTLLEDDVQWRVKLPKEDWFEVDVPHAATNQMRTILAKRGVYIDEYYVPHMTKFMSAYMRKLQNEIPREMAFAKLGWRKDHSFVVGDTLYRPDGTHELHAISHALQTATEHGMLVAGDFDLWRQQVQRYSRPGLEPYRAYLYSTFASPLYHLTGQIATCVSATGVSGVGKSTLMDVCASVWGDPSKLMIRGDKHASTRAAAEVRADGMHHLPVWMDEITGRDAKDVAELIFNYSGGKGKIRSTAAGGIRNDTATWSNLLLVNANTDEYERIASVFRDSSQHMMRLVQLEFLPSAIITKSEGDLLRQSVHENFGHAGRIYVEYLVQNYDTIKKRVRDAVIKADKIVGVRPEERFWTGWVGSNVVAMEITHQLGILPNFPISTDELWHYHQITTLRQATSMQLPQPGEIMSEFLEAQLPNTLTIGAKGSGNIDNVLREPRGELNIRFEIDTGIAFVSRTVFRDYCIEKGVNFNRVMDEMDAQGVIRRYSVLKVLGSETPFSKGKVRCIEIDVGRMGGGLAVVPTPYATVLPITAKGGKP